MIKYKNIKFMAVCSLVLGAAMLLSSCSMFFAENKVPEYIEGQRLELEERNVEYTPEQISVIIADLTKVAKALKYRRDGILLGEDDVSEMALKIEKDIVPALKESGVSYEKLISLTERTLMLIDNDETVFNFDLYNKLYLICMDKLGREKSGKLIYLSALMYLEDQADLCEKRYNEYGYEWYLSDAEKYRTLAKDMKEVLGEYEFTDAVSIAFFAVSTLSGTPIVSVNESSFYLDSSEMLVLLKKQADMINEHKMSSEQWSVVTRFAFEVCYSYAEPCEDWKPAQKEMITALKSCPEYATAVGKMMPKVSALYVAMINRLNEGSIALIMSNSSSGSDYELIRLMSLCEKEFVAMVKEFERYGGFNSQYELEAIENAGAKEDFQKYSKYRKKVTSGQLFDALKQCAHGKIDQTEFRKVYENFMYTNAPYMTYAFIFLNK